MALILKKIPAALITPAQADSMAIPVETVPIQKKYGAKQGKAKACDANEIKPKRYGHARPRVPLIPIDQPSRMYAGHVMAVASFSAVTLNNRIKDGRFPAPRYDGHRRWWPSHEVKEALGL